jgi:trk system potassium uptake protein TrkH
MSGTRRQDLAIIARDIGSLLLIQALVMTVSLGVAVLFREWYAALAFLVSGGITAGIGGLTRLRFLDAPDPLMKHGMVIAAAGWFFTAVFGSLPFLLTAHFTPPSVAAATASAAGFESSSLRYFRHPLHALFESMSGWTGSGLTMAVHEPTLPRAIQWWRSVIQWVGGVGVIVLTVAILSRPGSGSYTLYKSETRERRIHPSIVSTVRTVWKIFVAYTIVSVLALFVAIRLSAYGSGLTLFEAGWQALNHAMTGLATGGFSVTDNSIGTYNSPLIEGVLLPVMSLGAIAFPIHFAVLSERDPRELFADLQTRWLFALIGIGVVVLSVQNLLFVGQTGPLGSTAAVPDLLAPFITTAQADAIRDGTFQFISALTCTGFQSSPIGNWSAGGKLLISGAMVLGGAAGSTVGGIKIIRAYLIAKGIRWQFSQVFLPDSAVAMAKIGDRKLSRTEMNREFSEAAIVGVLWLTLLAASSLVLVNLAGAEFGYADALFEVASAQGNVGLSTGIVGPSMHPLAEGMFVLNMWIGRLEIIPVLVFGRALVYGLRP